MPKNALKLIQCLIVSDPEDRICEAEQLKTHPYFDNINWDKVRNKKYKVPFVPSLTDNEDLSNFDAVRI